NTVKPQNVYGIKVNNDDAVFVPKLKIKHNSLPLTASNLRVIDEDTEILGIYDQDSFGHPYQFEISHLKIPDRQLKSGVIREPLALSKTDLILIDTKEKLETLRDTLCSVEEFAVDLEHNSYRSFLGLTCLIQISTRKNDYIIDPFPIWNEVLFSFDSFLNHRNFQVFHGPELDVLWLQRDFGIYVVNMFDTHSAMKALNYPRFSLQFLIESHFDVNIDKQLQKSDWTMRPLSDAHIEYARKDTHYLLSCYDYLRESLINLEHEMPGILQKTYEDSKNICLLSYSKPKFQRTGFEKLLQGRKSINNKQRYALSALWQWRDTLARLEDESHHYILPNHMLLQIAEILPREQQGILACCSPIPKLLKQELHTVHRIISAARDLPLKKEETYDVSNYISVTFEKFMSNLNKMTKLKALLGEIHEIGMPSSYDNVTMCLINKKLDEWASPFESYLLSLKEDLKNIVSFIILIFSASFIIFDS
ncbi:unnamed protein product, partial [Dracunculus medinensis]|uniref:HRDC domain-containing protein n=1 Tax=Dracunculus medinensis TaxID=318479 RepID=A0A0N4UPD0_DRAME